MPPKPRELPAGPSIGNAFRSMPEQNVPPAPVSTPTRRSGSPSSRSIAAATPSLTLRFTALRTAGRSMVTRRTPPLSSVRTPSAAVGRLVTAAPRSVRVAWDRSSRGWCSAQLPTEDLAGGGLRQIRQDDHPSWRLEDRDALAAELDERL